MSDDPVAILASSRASEPRHPEGPHLWPLILIMLVLLGAAVMFFGPRNPHEVVPVTSSIETPQRDARVYTVTYRFGVFSPTNLRIHSGDTVRFRNDSPLGIRVVAEIQPGQRIPEFDSVGPIESGSYFSYTFATTGTFAYSNYSNSNESGVIIVR